MKTALINGVNMNYVDEGNGTALVFIHGLGENLQSWHYQTEYFKNKFRVVAMDLRGHGASRGGEDRISMEQFAADVATLLEYLNIEKAHFIGLSMGGLIAQELTKKSQKLMLSLCLCDTAACVAEGAAGKLPERLDMIDRVSMDEMADFIVRACMPYAFEQRVYDEAYSIFRGNRREPYKASTVATFSVDFRAVLPEIVVPVKVIVGELDQSTPVSAAEFLHDNIAGSELEILSGVGHLSKLENPAQFNTSIECFVEKQR